MLAFKTLKPLLNRVVIKKAEALTKTKGGIILTSGKKEEHLATAKSSQLDPAKSSRMVRSVP